MTLPSTAPSAFPPPLLLSVDPGLFDKPPTHPVPSFHGVPYISQSPTLTPLPLASCGLAGLALAATILVAVMVGCAVAGVILWIYYTRKNKKVTSEEDPPTAEERPQPREGSISLTELDDATSNFSEENIIGQGGFGCVYIGKLKDGQLVAVKKLSHSSSQGDPEFQAEVDALSRIHHRNLVRLLGHCISGQEKLLVYEFVPNGTLKHHLHDQGVPPMGWPTRMKVATGIAKGLAYLHDDCMPVIIHRDIKATNILLGEDFEPKVSDFGLARHRPDMQTHVSTRPKGTPGYLDPTYESCQVTEKTDVFSFGVILLELITGRIPLDNTEEFPNSLLYRKARPLLQGALDGHGLDPLVDCRLSDDGYNEEEMIRMVACAAACTRQSPFLRPEMSQVLGVLQGSLALSILNRETPEETSEYMAGIPEESQSGDASRYSNSWLVRMFQGILILG